MDDFGIPFQSEEEDLEKLKRVLKARSAQSLLKADYDLELNFKNAIS